MFGDGAIFETSLFKKLPWSLFWVTIEKIGLLFIPVPGHTAPNPV